jgi:YD repeat-containing protein
MIRRANVVVRHYKFKRYVGRISGPLLDRYQYYGDGRLKYSQDLLDGRYDRTQVFDQSGRLTTALSGPEARGLADNNDRPYRQSYQYDALDQLASRSGNHWSSMYAETAGYVNRRRTNWSYDAEGNLLDDNTADTQRRAYDAAGRLVSITDSLQTVRRTDEADGDGRRSKSGYRINGNFPLSYTYYLRSSVIGGEIMAEVTGNGQVIKRYVRSGGGSLLASQSMLENYFIWMHEDPAGQSLRVTDTNGNFNNYPGPTFKPNLIQ